MTPVDSYGGADSLKSSENKIFNGNLNTNTNINVNTII